MKVKSLVVQLSSHQPERLTEFYKDVVGLEIDEVVGGFKLGDAHLVIDAHSEISESNPTPARFLVNMFVDDVEAEQKRLEGLGVPFIRKLGKEFWGGIFSTFIDPDGNYAQIVEFRPG